MYISDDNTGVSVMQKDGTITSLGLQGLGSITSGLALDERDGYLFVGDNSTPQIHVFLPGQNVAGLQIYRSRAPTSSPSATLAGSAT